MSKGQTISKASTEPSPNIPLVSKTVVPAMTNYFDFGIITDYFEPAVPFLVDIAVLLFRTFSYSGSNLVVDIAFNPVAVAIVAAIATASDPIKPTSLSVPSLA